MCNTELTKREMEVLELVAQGWTNQEIATLLFITLRTVEHHVTNINEKLQTTSRLEAALKAGLLAYTGPTRASHEKVRGQEQSYYVPLTTHNKNSGKPP